MNTISINIDDDAHRRLIDLVQKTGMTVDEVVSGAVAMLHMEWSIELPPLTPEQEEAIRAGLADIDQGRTIPHEQVMAELDRIISRKA